MRNWWQSFSKWKIFFRHHFPPTSTSFLTWKKKSSETQTNFSCLHENGKIRWKMKEKTAKIHQTVSGSVMLLIKFYFWREKWEQKWKKIKTLSWTPLKTMRIFSSLNALEHFSESHKQFETIFHFSIQDFFN